MKVNDEPMALWFLSQIVISDSYNLKNILPVYVYV
jgi:hypothetical protein